MLTLHEAIVEVLQSASNAMAAGAIAAEVNRLGLYARRDGTHVPGGQISARVNKYPQLFTCADGLIGLSGASPRKPAQVERPGPIHKTTGSPVLDANENERVCIAPITDSTFRDVGYIGELLTNGLPADDWLDQCGVYALLLPPECEVSFLDPDQTRKAGNVISPWEVDRLASKWVNGTRVVYIGLAGWQSERTLRTRLKELLDHCAGKISVSGPHKGGEILWQLSGYNMLLLRAMPTGGPPEPLNTERHLLAAFSKLHGALPFANRRK